LSLRHETVSPFYPPRARWYGRFFYLGLATRLQLALDRIRLPKEITFRGIIAGLLIPGLAVYICGPRFWGKLALSACAMLFLFFIVWLGYPLANIAFGLMLSIHASGFVYYCSPCLSGRDFPHRLIFILLVLAGIGLGVYLPIQHAVQNHWLMPLRNGNQVIIVSVQSKPASLERGEWAAFVREDGVFLGQIAGLGGEQVDSMAVPEDHWLIHAQYVRRYYHGDFPVTSMGSGIVVQSIIVSRDEFIGKPFKRWFWRKQILQ
jgi:hypothetical protein